MLKRRTPTTPRTMPTWDGRPDTALAHLHDVEDFLKWAQRDVLRSATEDRLGGAFAAEGAMANDNTEKTFATFVEKTPRKPVSYSTFGILVEAFKDLQETVKTLRGRAE